MTEAALYPCDWRGLAEIVRGTPRGDVDVLCVDAPYSARTHEGHHDDAARRALDYAAWSPDDVAAFVAAWSPLTRGWFLSLTDDVLAPVWKSELAAQGRWVGTTIPCTERGGTVRLCGGGPSSCTTFLVVARPRTREYLDWITTESHYVVSREKKPIVGGKPLALMGALLSDYSRPSDLVCDPCAGGASTLRMAVRLGRDAIGSEPMPEHYEIGARLLAGEIAERSPDVMSMRKQPRLAFK